MKLRTDPSDPFTFTTAAREFDYRFCAPPSSPASVGEAPRWKPQPVDRIKAEMEAHSSAAFQRTWKLPPLCSRSSLRTLFCATLVAAFWSQAGHAQEDALLKEPLALRAEFKFNPGTYGIPLPVIINGQTNLFLLDTGCGCIWFDTSLRSVLGRPIKRDFAEGPGQSRKRVEWFAAPAATLGPLSLQTLEPVLCVNLEPMRRLSGTDFRGVVGLTFLHQHFQWLDFDNGRVLFLDRPAPATGTALLTSTNDSLPYITATLPTGKKLFLLDSGDDGFGSLAPNLFDELLRSNALKVLDTKEVTNVGGVESVRRGRLNTFEYGGRTYQDAVFLRQVPTRLGWAFLTNYNWFLDWQNGCITSAPRRSEKWEKKSPQ